MSEHVKPTIEEVRAAVLFLTTGHPDIHDTLLAALDVAEVCVDWTADHDGLACHMCDIAIRSRGQKLHDRACAVGAFAATIAPRKPEGT